MDYFVIYTSSTLFNIAFYSTTMVSKLNEHIINDVKFTILSGSKRVTNNSLQLIRKALVAISLNYSLLL